MPTVDVPFLGTAILCLVMVASGYTFAVSVAAGRGRPHMLVSARYATYATCALVAVAICLLAYAFQTHDFRIRYVARYSDRSMAWYYLVTSLWGGQDGSLLWWLFLLAGYTAACVRWMKGRYAELQPWVLATLASIFIFFSVLMLWAANPFYVTPAVTPVDGEGLNPLLQNYWMVIHPPMLYLGFVGWSIPFAFVMSALLSGRVHDEWLVAARRWTLLAWLFLSIGLLLGMLWSYEELGWGGYWAWDPVENASLMPWLVGTAFLHSVMIQERYGMLKVWNVFLICLTFFMTIFGTFLTRSGLIASVHSFAKSDIGVYFVWYMALLIVGCFVLIAWRLPELRGAKLGVNAFAIGIIFGVVGVVFVGFAKIIELIRGKQPPKMRTPSIQSMLSREFAFLLNNWIFLALMFFVLALTTWPLMSEWIRGEEVTVGPPVYNRWAVPFGIVLLVLAGVGPLISWRKATGKNLLRAFAIPTVVGVAVAIGHVLLGEWLGFAPYVETEAIYETATGDVLQAIYGISPLGSSFACSFVLATIAQEFWRGTEVRMRTKGEDPFTALIELVTRAKRRYGGYVVHVAIVLMYIGFTGAAYDVEAEAALRPGETLEIGEETPLRSHYVLRYDDVRMEVNPNRRAIFTDMTVLDEHGEAFDEVAPAKFVYTTHPEMPTTEVAIRRGVIEDLYVIMSTVTPESKMATFRVIVRPGVNWIWLGGIVLILGTFIAIAPSVRELLGADREGRGVATALLVALALGAGMTLAPSVAGAQDSSSLHAGTVIIDDPEERRLFERLLCMCGDCQRLTLASCACGWAEDRRAELRTQLSNGASVAELSSNYRAEHGARAIAIPADEGLDRALWAVPVGAGVLAAIGVVFLGLRWRRAGAAEAPLGGDSESLAKRAASDEYASMLDEELDALEGD